MLISNRKISHLGRITSHLKAQKLVEMNQKQNGHKIRTPEIWMTTMSNNLSFHDHSRQQFI